MAREEVRARTEVAGTAVGLFVFSVGVALLLTVFLLAFGLFREPGVLTDLASRPPGGAEGGPPVAAVALGMGKQILGLFIMLLGGSLIASKGVHLYSASR